MQWLIKTPHVKTHEDAAELLGYLPFILRDDDPRLAKEQIEDRYSHGGGWNKFDGFTMAGNGDLLYPGDPPTKMLAETTLHGETIRFYEHDWLVIMQPNGEWEEARVD